MDAAERDVMVGVLVPDPNGGAPYHFRPLGFDRGLYWWQQLVVALEGGRYVLGPPRGLFRRRVRAFSTGLLDPDALNEFVHEVETTDGRKLGDLPFNVPEVLQVARRFLAHTRPGWSPWPAAAKQTQDPNGEAEAPPSSTS